MKSQAASSYDRMWSYIEQDLSEIAADRYVEDLPELGLLCAIVTQAGRDGDEAYFKSAQFHHHARLLKIDAIYISILVSRAWNFEKSSAIWAPTPSLEEEWDI
jgi:hypothetical protein